jgi:5-methylcytosine-specific restriction endonuclease McrA
MAGYVERGVRHLPDGREIDLTERAWQCRRKALYEREEGVCEDCGRYAPLHPDDSPAGHAAHVTRRKVHDDRLSNLRWLCARCHILEHNAVKLIA